MDCLKASEDGIEFIRYHIGMSANTLIKYWLIFETIRLIEMCFLFVD